MIYILFIMPTCIPNMFTFYLYIECRDGNDDEEKKNNGFLTFGKKKPSKINPNKTTNKMETQFPHNGNGSIGVIVLFYLNDIGLI